LIPGYKNKESLTTIKPAESIAALNKNHKYQSQEPLTFDDHQ